VTLLALAAILRVLTTIAYRPAFWFYGDSGAYVALSHQALMPHNSRALGYVVVLKVFKITGSFVPLIAMQHLTGLLLGLAAYALLVRRGLPRWLALALRRRLAGEFLLLTLISASLLVLPVLVSMYETRYTIPALPFLGVLAALAAHSLWIRQDENQGCRISPGKIKYPIKYP
jgi:hypothetical protein